MSKKEVQPLLTKLSEASLVQLQDVPRSADRAANRTIFLWSVVISFGLTFARVYLSVFRYVDLPKTYSVLLTSAYKTLGNILTRRAHETSLVQALLDKRSRSDVSDNWEVLMGRAEREALEEYERKMEEMRVLEMRTEETVFVLKDLGRVGWAGEVDEEQRG